MEPIRPDSLGASYEKILRDLAPDCLPVDVTWSEDADISPLEWARGLGVDVKLERRAFCQLMSVRLAEKLDELHPWPEFIEQTPISYCRQNNVVALTSDSGDRFVVLASVDGWHHIDIVGRWMHCRVHPMMADESQIAAAIDRSYEQRSDQTAGLLQDLTDVGDLSAEDLIQRDDLLDSGRKAPVIQLVNSLLFEAVRSRSSDVHVQPRDQHVAVRMRIDGVLFDVHQLPKSVQDEVVTRLKVLGRMNIAEKRLPQDGRATVRVGRRIVDLRIASMPTNHGERVVVRLLDKSARLYTLEELGMDSDSLTRFRSVIHREHGLVLVTGPTGSGKSTTLYSSLQELNTDERNAVTLEDPIEYELDGISQTQINTRKGLTFASGLRSVLRQDPDIIMLGEIRDQETAVMAVQSSLTGHMVFSTLHTNDAASAVTRLLDLGIEPYLASSSLLAVLAQRLVRKICPQCRREFPVSDTERQAVGLSEQVSTVFRGTGCSACRGTGYQGRFGVFELLMVSEKIQQLIQRHATAAEIRSVGIEQGMRPMRLDGLRKITDGLTTIDEVARVTTDSQ